MSERRTLYRAANVRSNTYDPDARTIDVVWSTGAAVARTDWWTGDDYTEVLSMDPEAIRLGRLNAGAPLLNSHDASNLGSVLGNVVPGSARVEKGKGIATVRLSSSKGVADSVVKIIEGSVRNISVGYLIHRVEEVKDASGVTRTATDWEPLEISACAVPADPGAQFRSRARPSGDAKRAATIRRWAAKARLPNFGERHVKGGTSTAAFWDLITARLSGAGKKIAMSKIEKDGAEEAAGSRHWARAEGKPVRDDDTVKKPAKDPADDDEDRDELVSDLDDEDQDDTADNKPKKDAKSDDQRDFDLARRRGEALIRKFGLAVGRNTPRQ